MVIKMISFLVGREYSLEINGKTISAKLVNKKSPDVAGSKTVLSFNVTDGTVSNANTHVNRVSIDGHQYNVSKIEKISSSKLNLFI